MLIVLFVSLPPCGYGKLLRAGVSLLSYSTLTLGLLIILLTMLPSSTLEVVYERESLFLIIFNLFTLGCIEVLNFHSFMVRDGGCFRVS